MNLLKALVQIGKDVLNIKNRLSELEGSHSNTNTDELDTGWIDIREMLESSGLWSRVQNSYIRRKGDWVYFEIHNAYVTSISGKQKFEIGEGFSTPWHNLRATMGSQPPDVAIKNNELNWVDFRVSNLSVPPCRLMWKTDDPFPMHLLKKDE